MTAAEAPLEITEPGVYEIPSDVYHADPVPGGSLSSTGARKLLPPSCPAIFEWERSNPKPPTDAFDLGHAAHDRILGGGPEIVEVPGEWRTDKAKATVAEIRARGAVPLHTKDVAVVNEMAAALLAHPFAGKLFREGSGQPEASLFARDEDTGVMRRGRLDWLPEPGKRRMIIPDFKTAKSSEPGKFTRSVVDYGYHCQAEWYSSLVRDLGIADDPLFVFVVQEKTPPYVVSVVQLDVTALRIGALLNRRAINTYAECTRTGIWPGYVDDVALASLPFWYEREYEEDIA